MATNTSIEPPPQSDSMPDDTTSGSTSGSSSETTGAGSLDTTTASTGPDDSSSSTGVALTCPGPPGNPNADQTPPTDPEVLQTWLEAETYRGWAGDTAERNAEHHEDPRVWLNDAMIDGLNAGAEQLPVGAAAVIEYHSARERIGWGVQVRFSDAFSAQGWYWYEWLEGEVTYEGELTPECAGCHGSGLVDFVMPVCPLL